MLKQPTHVSVCICTYKRPELLTRLLKHLCDQETGALFTYSIVIVDNDSSESGKLVATAAAAVTTIPIKYYVEPKQNIALARNKAVENATGELLAFIDDDEFPITQWLLTLFKALDRYKADGVLGPVKPHFDDEPPRWVVDGGFYDRPTHPTGQILSWSNCRTGNVLLRSHLFADNRKPFRPECLSGEDQDFFRRMIETGHRFTWCDEAVVYEVVPPVRWERRFMIRRAVFRGVFSVRNRPLSFVPIATSLIATPLYLAVLPAALVLGQARFMRCLFTVCYHLGRLLAIVGINPIKDAYVTE
jgi:succinoglycan biosynthesis protein ExoM